MEILKQYSKHFIDKMFFLSISFKVQSFLLITGITSWLTALGYIDGNNYALVMSTLITTVLISREYSKTQANKEE